MALLAVYHPVAGRSDQRDGDSHQSPRRHCCGSSRGTSQQQAEPWGGGLELGGAHSAHSAELCCCALHDQVHHLPRCCSAVPGCPLTQGAHHPPRPHYNSVACIMYLRSITNPHPTQAQQFPCALLPHSLFNYTLRLKLERWDVMAGAAEGHELDRRPGAAHMGALLLHWDMPLGFLQSLPRSQSCQSAT